jgi:hypothetical protein
VKSCVFESRGIGSIFSLRQADRLSADFDGEL